MARPGRKYGPEALTVLNRRTLVISLRVRGLLEHEIAAQLVAQAHPEARETFEVCQQTVSRDLKWWRKRQLARGDIDADEHRDMELAKLDALEAEAWQAWERSKKPRTRKESRASSAGDKTSSSLSNREEQRDGDPRFMAIIAKCVQARAELRGLVRKEEIPLGAEGIKVYLGLDPARMVPLPKQIEAEIVNAHTPAAGSTQAGKEAL